MIKKITKLKNEKIDKNFICDYIKPNGRITTSPKKIMENSKNHTTSINNFSKYNFSNINNIRNIYLRNNNYISTEINNSCFNRGFNNLLKGQNDKNENFKKYKPKNNKLRKVLAPIYEINVPSKNNKIKYIYNNHIIMNAKQEQNHIKPHHISPNRNIYFRNRNYKEYSNLQKYVNYYPYIEKIKKIRANNSNDKIFMNRQFNNTIHSKNISSNNFFNIMNKENNSYIYNSPMYRTSRNFLTQEEPDLYQAQKYLFINGEKEMKNKKIIKNKEIDIKKNCDYKFHHKQLSLRKYFGDNYKYFERNESPLKIDKTFHRRRSPAHIFGYENYFIIEDSNDRLIATNLDYNKKFKILNSEGNNRMKKNNIFIMYKNY